MPDEVRSRTCMRCGTTEPCAAGSMPDGWSVAVERGRPTFHCGPCLKANLVFVEGGIATEWWDG